MRTKQITRVALMTALVVAGRMSFSFLPNIQPMTVLIVLITLHFGFSEGLLVSTLSLVASNLYMGMGPWTLSQLVSFGCIVLLTKLFSLLYNKQTKHLYVVFVALMGLSYGLVISLVQAPFFGWASFWPYYVAGIPYDVMHAIGNIGFWFILEPVMSPLLIKQLNKKKAGEKNE